MKITRTVARLLAGLMCVASLSSCGGGSGAASGSASVPPPTPAGEWLTLTPSAVDLITYEGEEAAFSVTGKSSKTFAKPVNMAIVDAAGVISTAVSVTAVSALEYRAGMHTATTLSAGVHTSNLEVRLCEDDPVICKVPVAGSPWFVPLKVTVRTKAEGAARLTVSPALDLAMYAGESISFTVSAKAVAPFYGKQIFVGVFDPSAIVTSESPVTTYALQDYSATLRTSATLAAGAYTTNLEVRLCLDSPSVCKLPMAGSPWIVPLKLTVKPASNFTALHVLPQVGAWSTHQGNAAHTGYVAASFDTGKFTRRWKTVSGNYFKELVGLAVDNGMIFNVNNFHFGNTILEAFREDTGQLAWKVDMGNLSHVNPPAAGNGKVFVTSTGHADSFFWVFDQATGALISKTATSSQWQNYLAPTVVGNDVYSEDGGVGGMSKFNAVINKMMWSIGLPQYDGWTPAVDASYAYAYMQGTLHAVGLADGKVAFKIADPALASTGYTGRTVTLSGKQMAYVADSGRLVGFDLANKSLAWSLNVAASAQPAYAGDVVYVLAANGSVLEAHSGDKGALLWTSNTLIGLKNETLFNHVIVTDNLAFVSSASSTLAIDLQTHKTVWAYPLGGASSISDRGVLYILSHTGDMAAINLQ